MEALIWPVRGLLRFLATPRWWGRALAGMGLALLLLAVVSLTTGWWLWPAADQSGLSWWWRMLMAVAVATATAAATWILLLPLLVAVLMEGLARQVLGQATGVSLAPMTSLLASIRVLLGTLAPRLGWIIGGLVLGIVVPPVGVVVSAIGMGHLACLDACDVALSIHGLNGGQRLAAFTAHRDEIRQAALSAGLLNLMLVPTVVGWLLWLPGVVVGATLRVQAWPEVIALRPPMASPVPASPAG